jgi:CHAT domain-containing protein
MRMLLFILSFAWFGFYFPGSQAGETDASSKIRSGLRYTTQVALSGRTDHAIRLAGLLLASATQCEVIDSAMVSDINCMQGALMIQKGDPRGAVEWFERSRRFCKTQEQASIIDQDEGTAWFLLGSYEKSILYFSRALYLVSCGQYAETSRVITLYDNLCAAAIEAGDVRLAESSLERRRSFQHSLPRESFPQLSATMKKEWPVHFPADSVRAAMVRAIICYHRSEADSAICLALSALDQRFGEEQAPLLARAEIHDLLGRSLVLGGRHAEGIAEFDAGLGLIDTASNIGEAGQRMRFLIRSDKACAMVEQNQGRGLCITTTARNIFSELMNARDILHDIVRDEFIIPASVHDAARNLYQEICRFSLNPLSSEDHDGAARLLRFSEEKRLVEKQIRVMESSCGPGSDTISGQSLWLEKDLYYQRKRYVGIDRIPGVDFLRESAKVLDLQTRLDSARDSYLFNRNAQGLNSDKICYVDSVQLHLSAGEGLISYTNAGNMILSVCVTHDTSICFSFANDDMLYDALGKFRSSIRKADSDGMLFPGKILRNCLTGPVSELLKSMKRIYVIADEPLRDLPVELLPAGNVPGQKNRYLVQDLEIAYYGSIAGWLGSRDPVKLKSGNSADPMRSFAGYSPPFVAGSSCSPLKFGPDEIDEIAEKFRARGLNAMVYKEVVPGDTRLLAESAKATILHLATHSQLNREYPLYSGFYLSGGTITATGADPGNDGLLELGELGLARLRFDLLVLSSCTVAIKGQGRYGGEYSFPDDLLGTGVKNVIYSLWNVSDRHTKTLMVSFYTHLLGGRDYVSALRLAKLDMLSCPGTENPWLWGGFILRGR